MKQTQLVLGPYERGFHQITEEIRHAAGDLPSSGMLNIFIHHSSAGLCISENTDPNAAIDLEESFNNIASEKGQYLHNTEGLDDMPAHIKSVITGVSLNIPIMHRKIALGTWQGIYLCEYRNQGGSRRVTVTVM